MSSVNSKRNCIEKQSIWNLCIVQFFLGILSNTTSIVTQGQNGERKKNKFVVVLVMALDGWIYVNLSIYFGHLNGVNPFFYFFEQMEVQV